MKIPGVEKMSPGLAQDFTVLAAETVQEKEKLNCWHSLLGITFFFLKVYFVLKY